MHAGMLGRDPASDHFKLVTASSPLQYLRHIRLDHAKRLMAHDGYGMSTAARAVGYEGASQFRREFKRLSAQRPSRRPSRRGLVTLPVEAPGTCLIAARVPLRFCP